MPSRDAYAVALIDRQRMVVILHLEERREARRARLDGQREMDRIAIDPDRTAQPPEVRRIACAVGIIPSLGFVPIALLAQRRPD
jgi:hypothetical protein